MMSMSHRIHSPKATSANSTPFSTEIPSPEALSLPRTSSRSFPNHVASGFGRNSFTTESPAAKARARSHSQARADRDCVTPIRFAPDDFETKIILGRGGFAWVRLAQHAQTHKFFAIKAVKKAVSSAKHTIADLADEKRALTAMNNLNCPFIVKFYGTYQVRAVFASCIRQVGGR
jgi:Protein kinase domain